MFGLKDPKRIASAQRHEALLHALEHEAAAEHHAALARMYKQRAERLQSLMEGNSEFLNTKPQSQRGE